MEAIALGGADPRPVDKLLGLVLNTRKLAVATYRRWAELRPEHRVVLRHFAQRVERNSLSLAELFTRGGAFPDRCLFERVLGPLAAELDEAGDRGDADALAVAQIFLVEAMVLAIFKALAPLADRYPGARAAFAECTREGNSRIEWTVRYLRLRFFEREKGLADLVVRARVPGQRLLEVASVLEAVGLAGADWSASLRDESWLLIERLDLPADDLSNVTPLSPG